MSKTTKQNLRILLQLLPFGDVDQEDENKILPRYDPPVNKPLFRLSIL